MIRTAGCRAAWAQPAARSLDTGEFQSLLWPRTIWSLAMATVLGTVREGPWSPHWDKGLLEQDTLPGRGMRRMFGIFQDSLTLGLPSWRSLTNTTLSGHGIEGWQRHSWSPDGTAVPGAGVPDPLPIIPPESLAGLLETPEMLNHLSTTGRGLGLQEANRKPKELRKTRRGRQPAVP